ncbi:MAG: LPS assembly lipoprotein LptE [Desulfobacterales bacterium]|nr:LPS assembly lipoprotein LptE [Desulfobacterales bacterium]MDX2508749.1 LPS assembly lipoprotein LptE [Desulfobacterales bacterium]
MFQKIKIIFFILCLLILVSGCGYRFAGTGDFPEGTESIFIPILENRTSESRLEKLVTDDLIYVFTKNRKDILAGSIDDADAVLYGIVHSISTTTISRDDPNTSSERSVKLFVDTKLVVPEGRVIWRVKGITADEAYNVVPDNKYRTEQNRQEAISKASQRLAEKIYTRMTDNF